jgi:hypothetical protein
VLVIPGEDRRIAPLAESVPPKAYGGTERMVSYLTDTLVGCAAHASIRGSRIRCRPRLDLPQLRSLCSEFNDMPARKRFEERFTAQRMARDYVGIYHALRGARPVDSA